MEIRVEDFFIAIVDNGKIIKTYPSNPDVDHLIELRKDIDKVLSEAKKLEKGSNK